MGNLKEFLENVSKEPVQRSNYFSRIEVGLSMTDEQKEQLASSVLDMVYELSGIFLDKLADILETRGLALDGHKIVKGFANDDKGGV